MSIENINGKSPRLLPRTIEDVLRNWMSRSGGLALVAAAVTIWVAMLTWSANDPSLSLNTAEPAKNILGPPGAMIADFFIHTLGLSVVFFALPPLVLGLQLVLGDRVTDHRRRMAFYALATVGIAGGCSALPLTAQWPLEIGYGGIIGDFVYSLLGGLLVEAAPKVGSTIAGLLFFAAGFWAFTRASCLDRYNILAMDRPRPGFAGVGSGNSALPELATGFTSGLGRLFKRQATTNRIGEHSGPHRNTAADAHHHAHASVRVPVEPEPPAWSLDARLHDYDGTSAVMTSAAMVGSPEQLSLDSASHMAGRFAPDAAVSAPHEPPNDALGHDPHQIVLLGDELASGSDDLPNVLKRARQEAADIMPPRLSVPQSRADMADAMASHNRAFFSQGDFGRQDNLTGVDPRATHSNSARIAPSAAPQIVATGYRRPSFNLLKSKKPLPPSADVSPSVLQGRARMLEDVLSDFRIKGEIQDVRPGPVITLFELEPSRGTKSSRVIALADDVARSMSAASARIAVVPGRNAIGIELPNTRRETFGLRELIDSQEFLDSGAKLPLVLGKGIGGEPVLADLARMPHLLIAGTTGSGKSVGVNAMILSLIYRLGPQDCRFLMIDPKMLELSAYNGIPHLLTPVITDPQKAITALAWAVGEMEERYKRMAELGVRSIEAFNNRVKQAAKTGEKLGRLVQTGFDPATGEAVYEQTSFEAEPLPFIVIVVDEFADLMAVAGKEIEGLVQRLAQMARAAGIHMIMATQRPSVDVVTGTIKANFPTRISYRVASRIDSRTILNEQGGEQLLGHGDMLFLSGAGSVQRVHGPFVSDEEVEAVSNSLRDAYPTAYNTDVLSGDEASASETKNPDASAKSADLYQQAVDIIRRDQKVSTSYLQRRLSIGYNRAADLVDRMEADGVIGAADHAGRREILLAG